MNDERRRSWTAPARRQSARPPRRRPQRPPALPVQQVETPKAVATLARWSAGLSRHPDRLRAFLAVALAMCGLALTIVATWADVTIHRGVGDGITPPVVRQYSGRDLAANVDLTRFAPEQLSSVTAGLQANGIRYVRQSFSWAEIEPAPGEYAWERYDAIVEALNRRSINLVAVLHRSPSWIRSPAGATAFDAPPADLAAYERFVSALASRYGDNVPFIQLWDLPNRPSHWGNASADAMAYVSLLAVGSNAARGANPNAVVLLAELDPFPGNSEVNDLQFLRQVYNAGGSAFFDIVAARVDGGARTPYDRTVRPDEATLSRVILLREAMAAAGDPAKPIWATHYGWDTNTIAGSVGETTQADYVVAGLERARAEWPWMGPLFQWGLIPGADLSGGTPAELALLREDGSPTPLFEELGAFAAREGAGAAPTGLAPVAAPQYVWEGNWNQQHLGADTYRTTTEVDARFHLRFEGTGVIARARLSREAGAVEVTIDGQPINISLASFQAEDVDIPLARRLPDGVHEVAMRLTAPGQLTVGGLVVERAMPMQWPILLLLLSGVVLLYLGIVDGALLVAERTGLLQRRGGELWPELPQIPDWRPSRRA
ncbi:MAG TPA: beta-galactosidase [Thermomicrobiales bacterium]|nr:beta-galactosidase [Thermomicrobiales bacterium]